MFLNPVYLSTQSLSIFFTQIFMLSVLFYTKSLPGIPTDTKQYSSFSIYLSWGPEEMMLIPLILPYSGLRLIWT